MNAVEIARKALLEELEPLAAEFAKVQARLLELEQSKNQLEAALKALSPNRRASPKRKTSKPCAKKADVMEVCLQLVQDNPGIPKEDLETMVKERLAKHFNLSGASLRISECLASKGLNVRNDGTVQIKSATIQEPTNV